MTEAALAPLDLRAVLFDSGGVLTQPIGGRWNPRADFEETVRVHAPWVSGRQFKDAIASGERFFAASASTLRSTGLSAHRG
jgi:hypothetical protein